MPFSYQELRDEVNGIVDVGTIHKSTTVHSQCWMGEKKFIFHSASNHQLQQNVEKQTFVSEKFSVLFFPTLYIKVMLYVVYIMVIEQGMFEIMRNCLTMNKWQNTNVKEL